MSNGWGFDDPIGSYARENEWANGHHESAEISCVALENTLSSPEEKSQDGEDAFIRELSQRVYSRFPFTEDPQNDYDLLLANPHSPTTALIMIPVYAAMQSAVVFCAIVFKV